MSTATSRLRAPALRSAAAALVAAAACWGVGTVVTKQVVDTVAPLTLLPLQLAASCVFLVGVALVRREPLTWPPPGRRLTALGALNPGLAYALGLVGLATITASLAVLLWAAEPVLILLLAALMLRERLPSALAAPLAVALAGGLVVYQPGASGDAAGIALTLVGVGCCALYTVLTRRWLLDDASLTVVLSQQVLALLFALLLATAAEAVGGTGWDLGQLGAGVWLGAAASGSLYYGLAFWLYLTGLRHVQASYAARLPAAHPCLRGRGRPTGRRAAGTAPVGGRGHHRGRYCRDRGAGASRAAWRASGAWGRARRPPHVSTGEPSGDLASATTSAPGPSNRRRTHVSASVPHATEYHGLGTGRSECASRKVPS
jgi:drug/metabolite transporter (DMT)-like permease